MEHLHHHVTLHFAQPPVVTAHATTTGHERGTAMGSTMEKIKGRLKEAAGVLTDNDSLKREGQRDQVMGEMQEKAERMVEKIQDA